MIRQRVEIIIRKPKPYWSYVDERVFGVGMSRAHQPKWWIPLPELPEEMK